MIELIPKVVDTSCASSYDFFLAAAAAAAETLWAFQIVN